MNNLSVTPRFLSGVITASGDVKVGMTGPYFTPVVSESGDLSWTNNGGLANPATVNIRGPQGPKGDKGDPGDVSSVNSVSPDGNGNVALTASDVPTSDSTSVQSHITSAESDISDLKSDLDDVESKVGPYMFSLELDTDVSSATYGELCLYLYYPDGATPPPITLEGDSLYWTY
mgnify:CR=1 FL=1